MALEVAVSPAALKRLMAASPPSPDPAVLEAELDRVRLEYNTVRLHAGIADVTPLDEHEGRGPAIRTAREAGLESEHHKEDTVITRQGTTAVVPTLLDIPALAEHLGVTPRHVRRLVAERRIPYGKWGHLIRFNPVEVAAWLEKARVPDGPRP